VGLCGPRIFVRLVRDAMECIPREDSVGADADISGLSPYLGISDEVKCRSNNADHSKLFQSL
jgi:hypothetical protein